ncbi:MAG: hypothetical protein WBN40_00395 [Pseudomonadales bacterium]
MKLQLAAVAVGTLLCISSSASPRAGAHAPINVMGDHNHKAGKWMFSYRFSHMEMQDNRDGGSNVSPQQIALSAPNRFPPPATLRVVPVKMSMQMHMLGAMYALDDRWTVMGMLHYMEKDMEHITFNTAAEPIKLGTFRTRARGIGDSELLAIGELFNKGNARLLLNAGLSLPTGKTNATDTVLKPSNISEPARLPYPMQLGSGTYDLITGLTYTDSDARWNWGSQWRSKLRIGENDEDYTLGDEHQLQAWWDYTQNHSLSYTARLAYLHRENIDGMNALIAAPVQTADPHRQALRRVDAGLGINTMLPGHKHRLALEFVVPVYQHLDGPQLKSDWQLMLGWQFTL